MKSEFNLSKIKNIFFIFLTFITFLTSCHKNTENELVSDTKNKVLEEKLDFKFQGTPAVLGKKLENPYEIEVMRRAYAQVRAENKTSSIGNSDSLNIRVTHLYVRFLPATWAMFDSLKKDKTLELYDKPMDYELLSPGDYYHDPTVPVGSPTWYYASIPINHSIRPNIRYEILAQLYIPEADNLIGRNNVNQSSIGKNTFIVESLIDKAMELTGNPSNKVAVANRLAPYIPSGRIRVQDDAVGLIPLEGVKIRMRQWFITYTRVTDANGNYSMDEVFRRDVNYSLVYEDEDFDVRSRYLGQATWDGPKHSSTWNVDISMRPQTLYAHIFRAAHNYYRFSGRHGINPPPQSFWYDIKIGAFDENDGSVNGDFANWRYWLTVGIFPQIRVYHNGRASSAIYSTTIHELAHAAHWDLKGRFLNADDNVVESWGRAVQWAFTNDTYQRLGVPMNFRDGWQTLKATDPQMKDGYTPIFIDLIDTHNQRASSGDTQVAPDNVSGFTLTDIQSAIEHSNTFTEIRDKLIALNRVPQADIEALFGFYINDVTYN